MRKSFLFILSFVFTLQLINAQEEKLDMDMMNKIRKEGLENSKVMEIAMYLTDVNGPRLTASPGYMRAATWAKNKLTEWGLSNANLEPWGEFGKGWEQTKCYVAMTAPYYMPLIAMPRAWTGSTPGKKGMKGEVVLIKAKDSVELMKYAGTLKGKIVMTWSSAKLTPSFQQMEIVLPIHRWKKWPPQNFVNHSRAVVAVTRGIITMRINSCCKEG